MSTGETAAAPRVAPHVGTGVCGDTRKFNGKNRLIFSLSVQIPLCSLAGGTGRIGSERLVKKRFAYENPWTSTTCFPLSAMLSLARWDPTQKG